MYFVITRLLGRRAASGAEPTDFCEEVRRAARPCEGLGHVYAQASDVGMDLVLFMVADAVEVAERFAIAVLDRALASSGSGLRIIECAVDLFIPGTEARMNPGP
ncbi:hypothetical protein [Streptacidiphilus sp. PAMC 29251]